MIPEPLGHALEATGYLLNGEPAAPSVTLAAPGSQGWRPSFGPDVWWRSNPNGDVWGTSAANLTVYFKYVDELDAVPVAEWQREIWNRGFSPLLWLVSPDRIELYNGFGSPQRPSDAAANRLETFRRLDEELAELDALAGRLAMETGQFWRERLHVNRRTSVDGQLLRDLRHLERHLVDDNLSREDAQGLIGRSHLHEVPDRPGNRHRGSHDGAMRSRESTRCIARPGGHRATIRLASNDVQR